VFELLIVNGAIVFLLLLITRKRGVLVQKV